jgi:hypothetical protein
MGSDGERFTGFVGRVCLLTLALVVTAGSSADAQLPGSVNYRLRLSTAAGTAGSLPFWLHTNQYGILEASSANTVFEFSVQTPFNAQKKFSYSYGVDAVGRVSEDSSVLFNGIFLKMRYSWLQLNAGRFKERLGIDGGELSSGPFMWSGNSRPMYKVSVFTNDYVDVPFTNGFLALSGYFGHGWFGNNRFVQDAYLHQKSAYAKVGGRWRVNVFAGLLHNAMWGGYTDSTGALPSSLEDFWSVFVGEGASTSAPENESYNRLGNHLGVWDLGVTVDFERFDIMLQKTTPFEDQSGLQGRSLEDGVYGLRIQRKERERLIDGFLWEFLYTKSQSGADAPDDTTGSGVGWDNYFNNYMYRDGWTYDGRILGTPLFSFDPLRSINAVFNNRVVAHHFGLNGNVWSTRYTFFYTYSRNYGTYEDLFFAQEMGIEYRFDPPLEQHAYMLRIERPFAALGRLLILDATVAADVGEYYQDNVGAMIGVKYIGVFGQ